MKLWVPPREIIVPTHAFHLATGDVLSFAPSVSPGFTTYFKFDGGEWRAVRDKEVLIAMKTASVYIGARRA